MIRRLLAFALVVASVLPTRAAFIATRGKLSNSSSDSPYGLETNKIYDVPEGQTITIKNTCTNAVSDASSRSGMTVPSGGMSAIYIPKGSKLVVVGAAGKGMTGGGAGIRLPSTSTLIVYGDGELEATGGAAASGSAGGNGGKGWVSGDDDNGAGGDGGTGGDGGGGAGAGIGGCGGSGGRGGNGGSISPKKMNGDFDCAGGNGQNGASGTPGEMSGQLYVLGFVKVTGSSGAGGGGGGKGSTGGWDHYSKHGIPIETFSSGSGAGGGGGGGGGTADGIGGGGAGGGGGGGGGSGGMDYHKHSYDYYNQPGDGGVGGQPGAGGTAGTRGDGNRTGDSESGGYGGGSNNTASRGEHNAVYKADKATVSGFSDTTKVAESHQDLVFKMTVRDTKGSSSTVYDTLTVRYGALLPMCDEYYKDEHLFLGVYSEPDGAGTQYHTSDRDPQVLYYGGGDCDAYIYFLPFKDVDWTGVTINGRDAAFRSGAGWKWSPDTLTLTLDRNGRTYALAGTNVDDRVRIVAKGTSSTLDLRGLRLETSGAPALTLKGYGLTITGLSDRNVISRTSGGPAVEVVQNALMDGGRLAISGGSPALQIDASAVFSVTNGTLSIDGDIKADASDARLVVNGGSVKIDPDRFAKSVTDGTGQTLQRVRCAVPDSPGDDTTVTLVFDDGRAYGVRDLYPIDDFLYLWLPQQTKPSFRVNGMSAWADIATSPTDAVFGTLDVRVDGIDVGRARGTGWKWSPATSNLVFVAPFAQRTLTGANTKGEVRVVVTNAANDVSLKLANLHLTGYGIQDGVIEVRHGAKLTLETEGTNTIDGVDSHYRGAGIYTEGASAVTFAGSGSLDVTGGHWSAAIGGRGGKLTFASGTVTARGGFEGAGIGGNSGCEFPKSDISVASAAHVTATPGLGAAAQGGGAWTTDADATWDALGTVDSEPAAADAVVAALTESALRRAVKAAGASGNAVTFAAGLTGTVTLAEPLVIPSSAKPFTLDGDGRVTLAGKGLRAANALTLVNLSFDGCTTEGWGGALYVGREGNVAATNCRFANCSADGSGGAVFVRGAFRAIRTTFLQNAATYGGSAIALHAPDRLVAVEHSTFLSNTAGERATLDAPRGELCVAACTLVNDRGGGIYANDTFSALSALVTANGTRIPRLAADLFFGREVAYKLASSTFGSVSTTNVVQGNHVGVGSAQALHPKVTSPDAYSTAVIHGVSQAYYPIGYRNKAILAGCFVWHDAAWANVAVSAERTSGSPKTWIRGGDATKLVLAGLDQIEVAHPATPINVGAVVSAAEAESLTVTTLEDTFDPDDGLTSLREAIAHSNSVDLPRRQDLFAEIRFDESLYDSDGVLRFVIGSDGVTLDGGRMVSITGATDGRRLVITGASGVGTLFTVNDAGFEVENLTVTGDGHTYAVKSVGLFVARNSVFRDGHNLIYATKADNGVKGKLWLENVSFVDNRTMGGALVTAGADGGSHLLTCTLTGNDTTFNGSSAPLVEALVDKVDLVNTTMAENTVGSSGVFAAGGEATPTVLNVISAGNDTDTVAAKVVIHDSTIGGTLADVFDGPRDFRFVRGVDHAVYRIRRNGPAFCTGSYAIYGGNYWEHLAKGTTPGGGEMKLIHGSLQNIQKSQKKDIVGRDIVQGHVSQGSYATSTDTEYSKEGVIEVNTPDDVKVPDNYDGLITLREAVDYAQDHPEFRDENGNCSIVFVDGFFQGGAVGRFVSKLTQMEVTKNFEKGRLIIAAPLGRPVVLDGDGKFRLFFIGEGNRVDLSDLAFENALGTPYGKAEASTSGGALKVAGVAVVSNCTFRGCWTGAKKTSVTGTAAGGAVCASGTNAEAILKNCTFAHNGAGYGGAVATQDRGKLTAVHCTFYANETVASYVITDPQGGAAFADKAPARLTLVNCTFAANRSAGRGGALAVAGPFLPTSGATLTPCVYAVNSVFVGNTSAKTGDEDLYGKGLAQLIHSLYGVRTAEGDNCWRDTATTGDWTTDAVFAECDSEGVPQAHAFAVGTQTHDVVLLKDGFSGAANVKADELWRVAGYWTVGSDEKKATPFIGSAIPLRQLATRIGVDQIGESYETPPYGATSFTASVRLEKMTGETQLFATVADAKAAAGPYDTVALTSDAATERFIVANPWYTALSLSEGRSTVYLNATAAPLLDEEAEINLSGESVVIVPANVKPFLWYALGASATPSGTYQPVRWIQADAQGRLPEKLTAAKTDASGFYKVLVTDSPR